MTSELRLSPKRFGIDLERGVLVALFCPRYLVAVGCGSKSYHLICLQPARRFPSTATNLSRLLLTNQLAAHGVTRIHREALHFAAIVHNHVFKMSVGGRLASDRHLVSHGPGTVRVHRGWIVRPRVMGPRKDSAIQADFSITMPLALAVAVYVAVGGKGFPP